MRRDTRTDWHSKVEKAIIRIFKALEGDESGIDRLYEEIASSPYHFLRTFRELTGETPGQCFRRLRLERAMARLRESESCVISEAMNAGFSTPEGFTKAFRSAFGISPRAARSLPEWKGLIPSKAGIHFMNGKLSHWFYIEEDSSMHKVKITALPEMSGYSLPHIGNYWDLPSCWIRFQELMKHVPRNENTLHFMTVFQDHFDDIPMENRRSAPAAVTSSSRKPIEVDGLTPITVPSGLYAIIPHFGSHEEIGDVWDEWRRDWLPASGWKLDTARPSLEWYQNGGNDIPAELYLTLLCDPVKKE